jgi:hypothetical protein
MSQITPDQKLQNFPEEFLKVYKWASQNTAETRQYNREQDESSKYKYFWPSTAILFLESLKLSKNQLIALVGLSGVGKSSAQKEIAKTLDAFLASAKTGKGDHNSGTARAIYFKWPGKFEANISTIADSLELLGIINRREAYLRQILRKANTDPDYDNKLFDTFGDLKGKTLEDLKTLLTRRRYEEDALIKKFLTKREEKDIERDLVISALSTCHSILINMRDYGTSDKRAMANDLEEIQKLWQLILSQTSKLKVEVPNLVFVLQKELAMSDEGFVTHFFLGKARIIEITPFHARELVDHYESEFGSFYPFKGAKELHILAAESRGIYRRFLRYIKLALEGYMLEHHNPALTGEEEKENNVIPSSPPRSSPLEPCIDLDMIKRTVDSNEIEADWKMDLERIFHNSRHARAASELVALLLDTDSVGQAVLLRALFKRGDEYKLSPSDASRIFSKLEQYGYIKRKRVRNEKCVSLNL